MTDERRTGGCEVTAPLVAASYGHGRRCGRRAITAVVRAPIEGRTAAVLAAAFPGRERRATRPLARPRFTRFECTPAAAAA